MRFIVSDGTPWRITYFKRQERKRESNRTVDIMSSATEGLLARCMVLRNSDNEFTLR